MWWGIASFWCCPAKRRLTRTKPGKRFMNHDVFYPKTSKATRESSPFYFMLYRMSNVECWIGSPTEQSAFFDTDLLTHDSDCSLWFLCLFLLISIFRSYHSNTHDRRIESFDRKDRIDRVSRSNRSSFQIESRPRLFINKWCNDPIFCLQLWTVLQKMLAFSADFMWKKRVFQQSLLLLNT